MKAFHLTPREWCVLRQIVHDHHESEIESGAVEGKIMAARILEKIDASLHKTVDFTA